MTNLDLLRDKITESGMTKTAIARKIGMKRVTFYNRLSGKSEFNASEIRNLTLVLHLSKVERDAIFFDTKREC